MSRKSKSLGFVLTVISLLVGRQLQSTARAAPPVSSESDVSAQGSFAGDSAAITSIAAPLEAVNPSTAFVQQVDLGRVKSGDFVIRATGEDEASARSS